MYHVEIPLKLPSLNTYIDACRRNRYAGASMKHKYQQAIGAYLHKLPRFEKPIKVHFTWVEKNKRRDLDNICWNKKFILDAMVERRILKDDNRKLVTGFTDEFKYGSEYKVILDIEEIDDDDVGIKKQ